MSEINQGVWAHGVIAGGDRKGEEKKTTQPKHSHLERISLGPLVCARRRLWEPLNYSLVFSLLVSSLAASKVPFLRAHFVAIARTFFFEVLPSHGCVCVCLHLARAVIGLSHCPAD